MSKTIPCRKVYKFRMEPTELQALELGRTASVVRYVYTGAQTVVRIFHLANGGLPRMGDSLLRLTLTCK